MKRGAAVAAALNDLILASFTVAGFVGEFNEAVAVIVLPVVHSPQIVGRNSNTTAVTPDWV